MVAHQKNETPKIRNGANDELACLLHQVMDELDLGHTSDVLEQMKKLQAKQWEEQKKRRVLRRRLNIDMQRAVEHYNATHNPGPDAVTIVISPMKEGDDDSDDEPNESDGPAGFTVQMEDENGLSEVGSIVPELDEEKIPQWKIGLE